LKCPQCDFVFTPHKYKLPEWLDADLWHEFVEYRNKVIKCPITELAQTRAINKLEKYMNMGYKPEDVIHQTVDSGKWVDLYEPRDKQQEAILRREAEAKKRKEQELPRKAAPDILEKIALLIKKQFDIARKLRGAKPLQKLALKADLHNIEAQIKDLNSGVVKLGDVI